MDQHSQLIKRAKMVGVSVTDVSQIMQEPAAILEYAGVSELVKEGVPTSWINARSQFYCDNKQLTKFVYEALRIPYPKSVPFQTAEEPALSAFFQRGRTYVCKPIDATNGIGVATGIRNWQMVKTYYDLHQHLGSLFMLEEQLEGQDLRIHVLGGKIVAACIREPAFVMGNGKDDLKTLIEKRRATMRTQNPKNVLEIDQLTQSLLIKQGIGLSDVPEDRQKVQLKYVSNMAQGGVATDLTEEIHPFYRQWVSDLTTYLKTGYFGLDVMTTDYAKHPLGHAWALEINARADWLHHTFSEGRTHDMAGMILEELFGIGVA